MDYVAILVPISVFAMVGWIVYIISSNGRRQKQLAAMTDFHAKVLDKMGSTKDFGEFLETDGGKRFMNSLTIEGPSAKTRIVKSTENGIVCLSVGIAFLLLGRWFGGDYYGLTIIGTIITACGVGFLISCLASYALSKSLGLFDAADPRK